MCLFLGIKREIVRIVEAERMNAFQERWEKKYKEEVEARKKAEKGV